MLLWIGIAISMVHGTMSDDHMRINNKFRLTIISLVLLALCSFGCTSTPKEDFVVNKKDSNLDELALITAVESETDVFEGAIKENIEASSKDVTIDVNIQIAGADKDSASFPVYKAIPGEIGIDTAKQWVKAFFADGKAYEPSGLTKQDIEERIASLRAASGHDMLYMEYGDEEVVRQMEDYYSDLIKEYENMYETAPEASERKETDWTFHPYGYYEESSDEILDKTMSFKCETPNLNGYTGFIWAVDRNESDYSVHNISFFYLDEEEYINSIPYKKLSIDEAKKIAEDTIEKLGFDNEWVFEKLSENNYGDNDSLTLKYVPTLNGIPLLSADKSSKADDAYASRYPYTELSVSITNGKLASVEYISPLKITEQINENVKNMGFEEAYGLFKKNAGSFFTKEAFVDMSMPGAESVKMDVHITNVKKALFRIKTEETENYMIVPVWGFYGHMDIETESGNLEDEDEKLLMLINAIDGSVIDPGIGY